MIESFLSFLRVVVAIGSMVLIYRGTERLFTDIWKRLGVSFFLGLIIAAMFASCTQTEKERNQAANKTEVNQKQEITYQKSNNSPSKPTPDMTRKEFHLKCGAEANHEYFNKFCKGKTVLLKGVIKEIDAEDKVSINIGDENWDLVLDSSSPRYPQGTRVEFSALLVDQMGWGAKMEKGHYWRTVTESQIDAEDDAAKVNKYGWWRYSESNKGIPEKCDCNSSPAEELKSSAEANFPTSIISEDLDGNGKVIRTTIKIEVHTPFTNGVSIQHFFRSKKECQESRQNEISEQKRIDYQYKKSLNDKYN